MSVQPADVYCSKEHVWAQCNGGICRIGITGYAQDQTGEIIYVDLPEQGLEIEVGTPFMELESNKAVTEVYAPLSGIVKSVNRVLEDTPELINQSPYVAGWLVELSMNDPGE